MSRLKASERRNLIWDMIEKTETPLSGTYLAKEFGVSRQVIVTDIAILREKHPDLVSTVRGYISMKNDTSKRVFKVCHSDEDTEDELRQIVRLGGKVLDITVDHRVYGTIQKPLDIGSERDVDSFMFDIKSGVSSLLKNITNGYHFHAVEAASEKVLDDIEDMLKDKGWFLESLSSSYIYEPKRYDGKW